MRRKAGTLLGIEVRLLMALARTGARRSSGETELHGFGLAKLLADEDGSRRLTSHGTLYKALSRLEAAGLVTSRWEDETADQAGRPRRRLYRITAEGRAALAAHQLSAATRSLVRRPGLVLP